MSLRAIQQQLKDAGFYAGAVDGKWGKVSQAALDHALELAVLAKDDVAFAERPPLGDRDFADAAVLLGSDVAKIRAVVAVESGGGWFTDIRKDILDLDGPGGFIDGDVLPKILFEAHLFSKATGGRYDKTHPNISSPAWNRALYIGGQAEYQRLHTAMLLDEEAALKSTSWGLGQILGSNFKAAGYRNVFAYVEAMKASERNQLLALVNFIKNTPGLLAKFHQIGADPASCAAFAAAYNGPSYATHNYDGRIAQAYQRARRAA
ncbi:N-acetylmuramidase domain-containing protein [Phenylobacterium sp.]|uniref:N-acetylmuramidase domain-containing protein n=1 Tax=Phenylobacterium sp. TaxID=1871053 RepID=UPI00393F7F31